MVVGVSGGGGIHGCECGMNVGEWMCLIRYAEVVFHAVLFGCVVLAAVGVCWVEACLARSCMAAWLWSHSMTAYCVLCLAHAGRSVSSTRLQHGASPVAAAL